MDRLARNLDDLPRSAQELTARGVRTDLDHERLLFTGPDAPMANLLLSVMGPSQRSSGALIRERPLEGIEPGQAARRLRGRHRSLDPAAQVQLFHRALAWEAKSRRAVEHGISRQSIAFCELQRSAAIVGEQSHGHRIPGHRARRQ